MWISKRLRQECEGSDVEAASNVVHDRERYLCFNVITFTTVGYRDLVKENIIFVCGVAVDVSDQSPGACRIQCCSELLAFFRRISSLDGELLVAGMGHAARRRGSLIVVSPDQMVTFTLSSRMEQ